MTVDKGKRVIVLIFGSGHNSLDQDLTSVTRGGKRDLFFRDLGVAISGAGTAVVRYHKRSCQFRAKIGKDPGFLPLVTGKRWDMAARGRWTTANLPLHSTKPDNSHSRDVEGSLMSWGRRDEGQTVDSVFMNRPWMVLSAKNTNWNSADILNCAAHRTAHHADDPMNTGPGPRDP